MVSWAQVPLSWKLASSLGSFERRAGSCQAVWRCMADCFNTSLELKAACDCLWRLFRHSLERHPWLSLPVAASGRMLLQYSGALSHPQGCVWQLVAGGLRKSSRAAAMPKDALGGLWQYISAIPFGVVLGLHLTPCCCNSHDRCEFKAAHQGCLPNLLISCLFH